ncbi:3-methyladenine DNA glycosylase AlkD [Streptococcus equinus]|uniref:3-methyladenine DNA glycosylase AlkD n=1 Tax=Streptococcus equinus TaxID=1335 RepID=A0A1H0KRC7_STREI|nr:DNA alkylation repair protein [Streptococcus equinus]SDO58544.1 3-methyladenine DNA glycosylase AlkD [Streptococcus equinus]
MPKYDDICRAFEANANPKKAQEMSAYMKKLFSFYGIRTPKRRAIYKDFLAREKKAKTVDWAFLNRCWEDEHRECQYLVLDYLRAFQKYLTFEDIEKVKPFISSKQWWDSIDVLAGIVGRIGLEDTRVDDVMKIWARDKNIWFRRIAILHQLGRKKKTKLELLEWILLTNLGSREFFINKAIGWALRDFSKVNPDWVRQFLAKNEEKLSSLSIREASKYL